jgi:hypothetical protein
MDQIGLTRLELTDEVRLELLRRAVSLLTECRACEPAMAYLKDVEARFATAPVASIDDLPALDDFFQRQQPHA